MKDRVDDQGVLNGKSPVFDLKDVTVYTQEDVFYGTSNHHMLVITSVL